MKTFSLPFLSLCLLFTTGCSGYSRLPKIVFIGKSREEVIRIFAQNPEKAWGTHINICTPLSEKQPYHCGNNRYFTTLEEALADGPLKKALALSGYRTRRGCAVPAGWDYYLPHARYTGRGALARSFQADGRLHTPNCGNPNY